MSSKYSVKGEQALRELIREFMEILTDTLDSGFSGKPVSSALVARTEIWQRSYAKYTDTPFAKRPLNTYIAPLRKLVEDMNKSLREYAQDINTIHKDLLIQLDHNQARIVQFLDSLDHVEKKRPVSPVRPLGRIPRPTTPVRPTTPTRYDSLSNFRPTSPLRPLQPTIFTPGTIVTPNRMTEGQLNYQNTRIQYFSDFYLPLPST